MITILIIILFDYLIDNIDYLLINHFCDLEGDSLLYYSIRYIVFIYIIAT